MIRMIALMMIVLAGVMGAAVQAQEHATVPGAQAAAGAEQTSASHEPAVDAKPHPVVSSDASLAGVMMIIVIAMFVAAAVIGPIVRSETPEEVPPAHSHDEPPGASGHHGASGTIDLHPPEAHSH